MESANRHNVDRLRMAEELLKRTREAAYAGKFPNRFITEFQASSKHYKNGHGKKSILAPEVHKMRLRFLKDGKQVTDSLIAKQKGVTDLAVQNVSKALVAAGLWERTKRTERDSTGRQIRTWYDYQITELGRAWNPKEMPFYINGWGKTVEQIKAKIQDEKKIVRGYFRKLAEKKKLKNSNDINNSLTYSIQAEYYRHLFKDKRSKDLLPLNRDSFKFFSDEKNCKTAKKIAVFFKDFLHREVWGDKKHKFSTLDEDKLLVGAFKLMRFAEKNKSRIVIHTMPYLWQDLALLMCEALVERFEAKNITTGHFSSPSDFTFTNVLPIYCYDQGVYEGEEHYESIADIPGVCLTNHQKRLLERQNKEEEEEGEDPYGNHDEE